MDNVRKIQNLFAGLVLIAALLSGAVTLTLNFRPLYYLDMQLLDISGSSGFSDEMIRENYDALISYNNFWYSGELEFPSMNMSESGRIHFQEVKEIFVLFEYGLLIFLPLSAAVVFWMRRKGQRGYLFVAGCGAVGLPAVLALLIAGNWEWFFVKFHELVFRNDYWLFDPVEDPVILILPDAFFLHCSGMILVLVIIGSVCFFAAWRRGARVMIDSDGAASGKL